jgi:flagellin-like protein
LKGISAVIATLLLLVITIGLAMTTYFYINNMVQRSTSKVITVEPGYCSGNTITLVITNTGTENITNEDIKYTLNSGSVNYLTLAQGSSYPIQPRGTVVATISGAQSGVNNLIIITPSGSIKQQIFC